MNNCFIVFYVIENFILVICVKKSRIGLIMGICILYDVENNLILFRVKERIELCE